MNFPDLMPRQAAPVRRTTTAQAASDRAGVEASYYDHDLPFASVEASWTNNKHGYDANWKIGGHPFAGVEASWTNRKTGYDANWKIGGVPFAGVEASMILEPIIPFAGAESL